MDRTEIEADYINASFLSSAVPWLTEETIREHVRML